MTASRPILIHTYAGPLGGSERILLGLMRRIGRPAILACPPGPLADAASAAGLPVIRLRERPLEVRGGAGAAIRAVLHSLSHGREVRRAAADLDPEFVVSWGMRAAVALNAFGLRASGTPGGSRALHIAEHVDLLPAGAIGWATRRGLLACDRIVCLSHAIARDLDPDATHSSRIAVVHPGVEAIAPTQQTTGLQPVALVLAAIEPWKGQRTALEAVARVPGVTLRIAGNPLSERGRAFESDLRRRAAAPDLAGRVEFLGAVDSHEALASATVLLHPAPSEPFGRAMAEALAAGVPVIASDAGGAREIVDESCGRLVPAGNVAAMTDAIREVALAAEVAAGLGSAGRLRAARLFDEERQAALWREATLTPRGQASAPNDVPDTAGSGEGSDLSIVTVIHDSAPDLARLLASIECHLPGAEVIVVDSGSSDGGAGVATDWPGGAKVTVLDGNEGFGAGCVEGLRLATRPVTAFINPDVELVDDSLGVLAGELADPASADRLLCPILLHPDGSRQDAVHPMPGSRAEILRALVPASALPRRLATVAEPHRSDSSIRVGWAVAACLLGRTATYSRLGPFDPTVQLYAEDLDLCLRAGAAGIATWYRPDARVLHREAHSTRRVFGGEPTDLLATRRRDVVGRLMGSRRLRADDLIQAITLLDRIAIKSLLRRDCSTERERLAALRRVAGRGR